MDGDRPGLLEQAPWVKRHKLDVHGYYRMVEAGIIAAGDPVELIEGEIIETAPIGSEHNGTLSGLAQAIILEAGRRIMFTVQGPLRLSDISEPQPDLLILKPRADNYRSEHPAPADVLLLIEVSQTSLAYDRKVKLPLYARHGVPEVWIVNIGESVVEVYRDPKDDAYQTTTRAARGDMLEPAALPGVRIAVDGVIG